MDDTHKSRMYQLFFVFNLLLHRWKKKQINDQINNLINIKMLKNMKISKIVDYCIHAAFVLYVYVTHGKLYNI